MDLNIIALSLAGFVLGGLVRPYLELIAISIGKGLRSKQSVILNAIESPEFKLAMVGFMGRINDTMKDKDNKEKADAAIQHGIKWITSRIPGVVDDVLLPPLLEPIMKGLYEGYIKQDT